jgi:hypothetical protein
MPTSESLIGSVLAAATRAPSSHNTQPWRFVSRRDVVELRADRTRALPVNDPEDRELTMSCGAALLTLRVAAAHHGLHADLVLLPDPPDGDLLARVRLTADDDVEVALAALYPAVIRRRTHRGAFDADGSLEPDLVHRMVRAATAEGAELSLLAPEARARVADLVEQGDRVQFADRRWRRELASWMRSRRAGDGLAVPAVALPVTRLAVAGLDLGRRTGAQDAELVRAAPGLAVLTTPADTTPDWLRAGQALQRALLIAASDGVVAGFVNQPCQVGGALRRQLAAAIGSTGAPQAVLRLGRPARQLVPTPRRPVRDVVEQQAHP